MGTRSSNSSIVDRLLAAKASDRAMPRRGAYAQHDRPTTSHSSATMSAEDRRELVQRMLQQRKQATFTDSPQTRSHGKEELATAPKRSPSRQPVRPGELISPASSQEGSMRADGAGKVPLNLVSSPEPDRRIYKEVSESSNEPLPTFAVPQHRYTDGGLVPEHSEGPPVPHACMSPAVPTKDSNRSLGADASPAMQSTSQLFPRPPSSQPPSGHPPSASRRKSSDSPLRYLPTATSPGIEPHSEYRAYSHSYGPTAAEPLAMEMSSMVLRGEHSDASLPHPMAHATPDHHHHEHPRSRFNGSTEPMFQTGPVLAPELSWQSTGASDQSLTDVSQQRVSQQRSSAAQPQVAQSRNESMGQESSATQSIFFACDLLAEGSARTSLQHTVDSESLHHDSLRHSAAAPAPPIHPAKGGLQHASQRQSLMSSGMGGVPPIACSTSAPSISSDVIDRAAAVDPFSGAAVPVPAAERSAATTDVSADLNAAGWPAIPTEAWGVPGAPPPAMMPSHEWGFSAAVDSHRDVRGVNRDGRGVNRDVHGVNTVNTSQAAPAAPVRDSSQLEAAYASMADSWQTQSAGALYQEHSVGERSITCEASTALAGRREVDLTAPVGRGTGTGVPHGRGRTRQEVLEEVMKERAAKGRPQRSQSARAGARPSTAGARSAALAAGSQRIERLARPRSIERYTARQRDAEEDELKHCTFAPQIRNNRRSASARRAAHRRDLSIPAGERLHHAHDHVAKSRTRKQTEAMQEELAACTFAPQLHPPPNSLTKKPYVPLHERAAQLVKQKNARLAQTRMNQELLDPQATFAPALNQRSIRLAALAAARRAKRPLHASMPGGVGAHRYNPSDTHASDASRVSNNGSFSASWAFPASENVDKNHNKGHASSHSMGAMQGGVSTGARGDYGSHRGRSTSPGRLKRLEPSESRDCTFAPAVNIATDAYLQKAGIPATFEERQAFYEQRRIDQAHVKQAALDPECTFHPQTAHPEAILAASGRRAHLDETQEEFWLRMTTEANRRDCMLRAIDNVQQQQFTFAPSINPRSRRLARSKNVDELATDPQRHAFREAAAAAAEQRLAQECTFRPDTSKPDVAGSAGVEPKAPFTVAGQKAETIIERIHEYHDGRCRKLEEKRNRREWVELQECTFAPKTNKGKPRSSSQAPVPVRGLDAHMSKIERAKKMAAEEAARRAKVFLEQPKAPRAKFTIAKPFSISDTNPGKEMKRMQLQEELKAEAMKECTFKPETNEGKKRHIIEQILAAEPPPIY